MEGEEAVGEDGAARTGMLKAGRSETATPTTGMASLCCRCCTAPADVCMKPATFWESVVRRVGEAAAWLDVSKGMCGGERGA